MYPIASLAASLECGSASPGGSVVKCVIGSATPQNISPMPMPTLNIIAIHDEVLNSGRSSSLPSLIRPKRLKARNSAKPRKDAVERTKLQPNQSMMVSSNACAVVAMVSGQSAPQVTTAAEITAATQKTTLSTVDSGVFCISLLKLFFL
ncbi:hypothetical protein D3C84_499280 [compost metagenome]